MNRILEVHRPVGYHGGNWPLCGACGAAYPCWDVLRVIEADS